MNAQQLSDALSFLEEDILQEADALRAAPPQRRWQLTQKADAAHTRQPDPAAAGTPRPALHMVLRRLTAAAAALAVVAGMVLVYRSRTGFTPDNILGPDTPPSDSAVQTDPDTPPSDSAVQNDPPPSGGNTPIDPALPRLTLGEPEPAGMGFEGYMVYDISELSAAPWQEQPLPQTLPVFRGLAYDERQQVAQPDFAAMEALLLRTAAGLGLDTDTLVITDDVPDADTQDVIREKYTAVGDTPPEDYFAPHALRAAADGLQLEVDGTLTVTIRFEPAVTLPAELHFTHDADRRQLTAVADWLAQQYAGLLDMETPTLHLTGGDRNIYGKQMYGIEFYDAAGDTARQLLNATFFSVRFACNDDGQLFLARVHAADIADPLGEYPLITAAQAEELLRAGHYQTTVPVDMADAGEVVRSELTYLTSGRSCWLPWYCFYVELPEYERDGGLKTYGAYYVPAVEAAYIDDMP